MNKDVKRADVEATAAEMKRSAPTVKLTPKPGQAARTEALREIRNDRVKAALAAAGRAVPLFRSP